MTYYSREIKMPATKREGLENFLQMVINKLEAGETREALMLAVDLQDDVRCGIYDDAMADAKGFNRMTQEMMAKHSAEIVKADEAGYERGVADEKARMAKQLGLAA